MSYKYVNILTTGNFRVWVLAQVGVENGVADLITHFICKQIKTNRGKYVLH